MRKLFCLAAALVVCAGCQPRVKVLTATPANVGVAPSKVTINWRLSAGTGYLSADKPVIPALVPKKSVGTQGSLDFIVCQTTKFTLEPYYGGERSVTVNVGTPCSCKQETLIFNGECTSSSAGPEYGPQSVGANNVGVIKDLFNNADFPIHVDHAGTTIEMKAGGGPVFPLPPGIPIAGQYKILVPGATGVMLCKDGPSPSGGDPVPAPQVQLTIVPECPKN
jgi:hypothetical protein